MLSLICINNPRNCRCRSRGMPYGDPGSLSTPKQTQNGVNYKSLFWKIERIRSVLPVYACLLHFTKSVQGLTCLSLKTTFSSAASNMLIFGRSIWSFERCATAGNVKKPAVQSVFVEMALPCSCRRSWAVVGLWGWGVDTVSLLDSCPPGKLWSL